MLIFPGVVMATDYSGESSSYLMDRQAFNGDHLVPFYEYLTFNVDNIAGQDLSFHINGWLREDLGEKRSTDRLGEDLNYAYLDLAVDSIKSRFRLGRIYVFEGVAAEQVDGVYAKVEPVKGLDVSAYTGSPVNLFPDGREGDFIYGGRVSYGMDKYFRVGASYLKEQSDTHGFREETGIDTWVRPLPMLDLQGMSSYNIKDEGWMEHTYHLIVGPFSIPEIDNVKPVDKVRFGLDYSHVDYRYYFAATTLSAFDRLNLNPKESYDMGGGNVELFLIDELSLVLRYKNYDYDISGSAQNFGGTLKYTMGESLAAGVSVDRMDGHENDLRYNQYRTYATGKIRNFDITADLMDVNYDRKINRVTDAYALVGSIGYNINSSMRVASDIEYSKSPYFDDDVRGMLKFIYKFGKG